MRMNAEIADTVKIVVSTISEKSLAIFPDSPGSLELLSALGLGFSRHDLIESKPTAILPGQIREAGHRY